MSQTMQIMPPQPRYVWLDYAKVFGMFLVIWGIYHLVSTY